jgi:hypothetical protein
MAQREICHEPFCQTGQRVLSAQTECFSRSLEERHRDVLFSGLRMVSIANRHLNDDSGAILAFSDVTFGPEGNTTFERPDESFTSSSQRTYHKQSTRRYKDASMERVAIESTT